MGDVLSRIAACVACTCFFFLGTFKCWASFSSALSRRAVVRWLAPAGRISIYNRWRSGRSWRSFRRRSFPCAFRSRGRKPPLFSAVPFLFFCILFCVADRKYALKVPLTVTGRIKRLSAVYILLIACVLLSRHRRARLPGKGVRQQSCIPSFSFFPLP